MVDTLFRVLKLSLAVAVGTAFMLVLNSLISTLTVIMFSNVVGEVLGVISCCLPFNAAAVFGGLGLACSSILGFLVAKKIFDLTSWTISTV